MMTSPPPRLRLTVRGRRLRTLLGMMLVVLVVVLVRALDGGGAPTGAVGHATTTAVPTPTATCIPDATTSQNCWPAFAEGDDDALEISPWVTGRLLGGDVRTVLEHVAARFDAEVEPVDPESSWGWANRTVRGEDGDDELSNHASGTSIDLNATEHPLGATGTFTDAQVTAIRAILADVAPVVVWGGDFEGRVDEMHFEIVGDADAVAQVAARLTGATAG